MDSRGVSEGQRPSPSVGRKADAIRAWDDHPDRPRSFSTAALEGAFREIFVMGYLAQPATVAVEGELRITGIADEEDGPSTGILIEFGKHQVWCSETSRSTLDEQGEEAREMLGGNDYGLFLHHSANDGRGTRILARVADLEAGEQLAHALARSLAADQLSDDIGQLPATLPPGEWTDEQVEAAVRAYREVVREPGDPPIEGPYGWQPAWKARQIAAMRAALATITPTAGGK